MNGGTARSGRRGRNPSRYPHPRANAEHRRPLREGPAHGRRAPPQAPARDSARLPSGHSSPSSRRSTDERVRREDREGRRSGRERRELEDILFDAFAAVREAFKRTIGVRLFEVQLMGGIVLHEGDIAEMKTGEGKTFVAVQALYLNALTGAACHSSPSTTTSPGATPSRTRPGLREARDDGRRHRRQPHAVRPAPRRLRCDVTYGTNSEYGFDYLRDNMAVSLEGPCSGPRFAIVDEVDSILVDEAPTPLIISGEPETALPPPTSSSRRSRATLEGPSRPHASPRRARTRPSSQAWTICTTRSSRRCRPHRRRSRPSSARSASRTCTTRATSSSSTT